MSTAISPPQKLPLKIDGPGLNNEIAKRDVKDKPVGAEETRGLLDAVDKFGEQFVHLRRLERASARQVLDTLDRQFPPSKERDAVRERTLDTLAWYRKEIEKWLSTSQFTSTPSTEEESLPAS